MKFKIGTRVEPAELGEELESGFRQLGFLEGSELRTQAMKFALSLSIGRRSGPIASEVVAALGSASEQIRLGAKAVAEGLSELTQGTEWGEGHPDQDAIIAALAMINLWIKAQKKKGRKSLEETADEASGA